jgi:hypothetical protein
MINTLASEERKDFSLATNSADREWAEWIARTL